MLMRLFAVVVASTALGAFADNETPAYWQVATKTWGEFAEPTNWKIGDPSSGAAGVPGVANYIWITATKGEVKTLMFDMGGGTHTVGGMSALNTTTDSNSDNGYGTTLSVTNGTLNLQGHVCGRLSFTLWNGATVRHSGDHRRGWGGGDPLITVHEGARFEELGKCQFQSYRVVVDAGGTYVLNPSAFGVYYKSANLGNGFTNRGRFEAPNGIHVTYTSDNESGRNDGRTTFRNEGNGVFLLGGNVESTPQTTQAYYYEFVGGTLEASNDVAFVDFRDMDRLFFDNAVEVKVDADSSLSLNGFTYGENAALTKTGAGKLTLGGAVLPSLTVAAGSVELNEGAALPTTISFASGTTLMLNASAIGLNPTAYSGMAITVDSSMIVSGTTLIQSDNAAFLSYARDAVNGGLSGDLGAVVYGDALVVAKKGAHMFDASASSDLADATAWVGGLPTEADDVIISGGVANYPAGSTKFKSILLQLGATLAVSGGTDESPVDLPPIELDLAAKLLISDVAQMTNVFTTVGDADTLPVLEIATNATLIAQSPEHPTVRCSHENKSYGGPDYGFRLKNVRLNWYGTIEMADNDLGDIETSKVYRHSRLTLGYAADGETSYIGVDCRGGKYLGAAEGNMPGRCLSALVIATPDKGGTVIPVGTLLFRDYTREDHRPSVSGNTAYALPGVFIGKCNDTYTGNPASVVYDVVFEGTTALSVKGNCSVAGGAHVYLRGPASWTYARTARNDENLMRCVRLYDEATLTVEDGAFLDICTTEHATYRGFQATGTTEGQRVFTARDAKLSLLNWSGSGKNTACIDNSLLEIGYLRSSSTQGLIDAVFNGLASVEIANRFTIAAADVDRGSSGKESVTSVENWDRFVEVGPPLTGAGSLAVSNELADAHAVYSMTVLVTNGANTATGSAQVMPTETGAPAKLLFADGANWAGTVVADANVGLTNLVDGAAAATANFGAISGTMPIRVWKTGGVITANDKVNLTSAAGGGFEMVAMGEELRAGDVVELGLYPENAALPAATLHREYSSEPSSTAGFVILKSTEIRPGFILMIR